MLRNLRGFLYRFISIVCWGLVSSALIFVAPVQAQIGNSGSIEGVVKDPSGGVISNASVEISYPVSGLDRKTTTDSNGAFRFTNVPFNPYHLVVTAAGFTSFTKDVEVRSSVPTSVQISLKVGAAATSVTVEANGGDLVENDSTFHTDVDRKLFDKLPLESASSSVSSLVTLATPGIAADSNGLFHALGDHAENSFSVDGQPITDQQSKVFSNQIPSDSIQSLEVISGAPPAEFGDKTSLIIIVTTRSGLGQKTPAGSIRTSYGSFGTSTEAFDLAYGTDKWGNFISATGLNTSRFLDPPEFRAFHDKGNEQNVFDRVDFQLTGADTLHVNLGYSRSWFQTPNSLDSQTAAAWNGLIVNDGGIGPNGRRVGPADQRSKINTFNVAPTWTHLFGSTTLFTFGAFVRQDQYSYYPSGNPFADLSSIQSETASQKRRLTNAGLRSDISYVKGIHNIKAGATYEHTFLREYDHLGIVDPTLLPSFGCPDPTNPVCTDLRPFDLTQGGHPLFFAGRTDVKELALYVQDTISVRNWSFNLGMRGDLYNGITAASQAEPRLGIAYNIKPSNTVLRISYARTLETPFNENLVVSSIGCNVPAIADLNCQGLSKPLTPGWRNEFHAGFQQAFGKYLVFDADYMWKYTHNGYDFSILSNTPITFPIEWHNSKIQGPSARVSLPNFHGLTAFAVFGHVDARFFPPQIGGVGSTITGGAPFRIDHDQVFQQTTHIQYQPWKSLPWIAFNWRYDSGLVVSGVPDAGAALGLTPNEQVTIGLACTTSGVTVFATFANPLSDCINSNGSRGLVTSRLITLPQGGYDNFPSQENDDHNPDRVKPRNLFDGSIGDDNVFHGDRYKWSVRLTVINLTNKVALYNFLSTFSGTHFVTPRTETVELGFHF